MQMNIQVIITIKQKKPIYLVGHIKKIYIWYIEFEYTNNAKVIQTLKLLI